ncbi:MAG: AAA family ATPase [Patescibacteria group bacterium]|nr:AAA family ATPase [Patescibacteria group bacterium]
MEIWAEKYRPTTLGDCILPEKYRDYFSTILDSGNIPNMLLVGRPGIGKTTVARALCNDYGANYIVINGSDESGIDTFRGKIKTFATTVSFIEDKLKVVIIDEADYLNPNSTQPALRNFMEEYSSNCRFIMTANFKQKIIDALLSRMAIIDFSFTREEKETLFVDYYKRVKKILKAEGCKFNNEEVLIRFIKKHFPDMRKILVDLQKYYMTSGCIDEGILSGTGSEKDFIELYKYMVSTDYEKIRGWVARQIQSGTDPNFIIRSLFDFLEPKIDSFQLRAQMIMILAKYQAELPFVADYEIHIMSMIMEIIVTCGLIK